MDQRRLEEFEEIFGRRVGTFNGLLIVVLFFLSFQAFFMISQWHEWDGVRYKVERLESDVAKGKVLVGSLATSWGVLEKISLILDKGHFEEAIHLGKDLQNDLDSLFFACDSWTSESMEQDSIGILGAVEGLRVALYDRMGAAFYMRGRAGNGGYKDVAIYGSNIIALDSSNWRGYRLKALGLWRHHLGKDKADSAVIKDMQEVARCFAESIERQRDYNIDYYNIVEFYFTQSEFEKALKMQSDLFLSKSSIPVNHEAQFTINVIEKIAKFIISGVHKSSESLDDELTTLVKYRLVAKVGDDNSEFTWSHDFIHDFSDHIFENEKIPEEKREVVKKWLDQIFPH